MRGVFTGDKEAPYLPPEPSVGRWHGNWFQKGDRFHWVGITGTFDTPNFGQFISNTTMGGEFGQAVSATSAAALNGNWSAVKAGSVCAAPAAAAAGRGGNPLAD